MNTGVLKNEINYLKKKLSQAIEIPREKLVYNVLPHFLIEILESYLRLEIEGAENIPRRGKALICPNHSGFAGIDALVLNHQIFKATHRIPQTLVHKLWFSTGIGSHISRKVGFTEASIKNGTKKLKKNRMVLMFPEGEAGNFKPSSERYKLRRFKTGFVRMAVETGTPIVPTVVIGAEESHINLGQLNFTKKFIGTGAPLPLNVLPFPAKWKIKFMEPIYLKYKPDDLKDAQVAECVARDIRDQLQSEIQNQLQNRDYIFFRI